MSTCGAPYVGNRARIQFFEEKANRDIEELSYLFRWHRHCPQELGHDGECGPRTSSDSGTPVEPVPSKRAPFEERMGPNGCPTCAGQGVLPAYDEEGSYRECRRCDGAGVMGPLDAARSAPTESAAPAEGVRPKFPWRCGYQGAEQCPACIEGRHPECHGLCFCAPTETIGRGARDRAHALLTNCYLPKHVNLCDRLTAAFEAHDAEVARLHAAKVAAVQHAADAERDCDAARTEAEGLRGLLEEACKRLDWAIPHDDNGRTCNRGGLDERCTGHAFLNRPDVTRALTPPPVTTVPKEPK